MFKFLKQFFRATSEEKRKQKDFERRQERIKNKENTTEDYERHIVESIDHEEQRKKKTSSIRSIISSIVFIAVALSIAPTALNSVNDVLEMENTTGTAPEQIEPILDMFPLFLAVGGILIILGTFSSIY